MIFDVTDDPRPEWLVINKSKKTSNTDRNDKQKKQVVYKGRIYSGLNECARDIGISNSTLLNRVNSKNFKDIYYVKIA